MFPFWFRNGITATERPAPVCRISNYLIRVSRYVIRKVTTFRALIILYIYRARRSLFKPGPLRARPSSAFPVGPTVTVPNGPTISPLG